MVRLLLSFLFILSLTGCAHQLNNDWLHDLVGNQGKAEIFNFDWQLSGDSSLLPLQAFDNGKKLWLHYPPDTVIPAFFARTKDGDMLLRPARDKEYLLIKFVPEQIIVRGGLLQAKIQKNSAAAVKTINPQPVSRDNEFTKQKSKISVKEQVAATLGIKNTENKPKAEVKPKVAVKPVAAVSSFSSKSAKQSKPKLNREYAVSPKDINLRKALKNWSKNSEWTFTDDHWAVDVDIPIAGSASFGHVFRQAVRDLLAATELGDRPLQPCFYSNNVLRVVPLAQRCDRTNTAGA